jgi:hypothetical protein
VLDLLGGIDLPILLLYFAFDDQVLIGHAKFVILLSSLTVGIVGFLSLKNH